MGVVKTNVTPEVRSLFSGWEEAILWSCLEGTMGAVYAIEGENPGSAVAILGDFRFFAGYPNPELLGWNIRPSSILIPKDIQWEQLMQKVYKDKATRGVRYAIRKEPDVFNLEQLRYAADTLPLGYSLQFIDQRIYTQCLQNEWSRDLVSQYHDYPHYHARGLGIAVLAEGRLVAGASSYSSYPGGIEIEIDTQKEYRRKGLAYACGAKLILECLSRGLYPSWDAQNKESVALAEKLGYHFDREYPVFLL